MATVASIRVCEPVSVPGSVLEQLQELHAELRQLRRHLRGEVPAYETLSEHLWQHRGEWFTLLGDPAVEPTNWEGEQAIRPAVVNRKVWGGNRTWVGARAQEVLMSVRETCRREGRAGLEFVSQTLGAFGNPLLPRPILLGVQLLLGWEMDGASSRLAR